MPPSRSDTRALVIAVASLVLAGLVVAAFLLWATRSDTPTVGVEGNRAFSLGLADSRYENLVEEGPVYFADPFGGDGIYLALEDGDVVALAIAVPGRPGCHVNWRGREDTFKDCDDESIDSTDLDRYEVTVPTEGEAAGQLVVNLDVLEPAPPPR